MKVYNLTDVETPALIQRGLVNQHIVVGKRMVNPGEFVEVADTLHTRGKLMYLLTVGAVSIDQVPPNYVRSKQSAVPSTGVHGSIPVHHMEIKETAIVDAPAKPVVVQGRRKGRR
jgi:hypothetical protein